MLTNFFTKKFPKKIFRKKFLSPSLLKPLLSHPPKTHPFPPTSQPPESGPDTASVSKRGSIRAPLGIRRPPVWVVPPGLFEQRYAPRDRAISRRCRSRICFRHLHYLAPKTGVLFILTYPRMIRPEIARWKAPIRTF
jgi:hypothetical protein